LEALTVRRIFCTTLVVGSVSLLAPQLCAAQTVDPRTVPELVTDRPDFTESSEVVGRGVLQVETGMTLEEEGESDATTRALATPQVLVRIGLSRRVELRLGGDGFVSQSLRTPAGSERTSGYSDAEIGAKVKLVDASAAGFDVAVIPALSLPTGKAGFSSTGYDPSVKLTWARELPQGFGLSGNFNAASITVDGQREWERAVTLSLGHGFGESWGAYWEGYGFLADGSCDCTINTGVTRAFGPNAQFDVEVGRGVSGDAPSWFVGVGFAVRHFGLR
jgi:hypothetical protein